MPGPRHRRGIAIAEFAVLSPVLVLALLGASDVAAQVQSSLRLERAAQAGAMRALADPSDLAAVRAAVLGELSGVAGITVPLPVLACACGGAANTCGAACLTGETRTVTVTATQSLSPRLLPRFSQGRGDAVARLR